MRLAAVCFTLLMWGSVRADVLPFADFSHQATVSGVGAAGLYRLAIDEAVWRCSRANRLLGDVRIAGPDDRDRPWRARPLETEAPPVPARVEVRSDGGGAAIILLDLGARPPPHDRLRLIAGSGDFVRPVSVDASDDGVAWRRIAAGGIVYRLGASPPPNAHLEVEHPLERSRWLRVTVGAGPTPAVFTGAEVVLRPTVTPRPAVAELELTRAQSDPVTRTTRMWLAQKNTGDDPPLPVTAITVDVPGVPQLSRRVVVSAEEGRGWRPIGSGVLYRPAAATVVGGVQEIMRLAVAPVRARRLLLELDDATAPPLQVRGALGEWPAHELVFGADRAGTHTLYVGSAAVGPPPATLTSVEGMPAEARLGMLEPNPRFGVVAHESARRKHGQSWVWLLVGVAAAVLAIGWRAWRIRATPSGRARWV